MLRSFQHRLYYNANNIYVTLRVKNYCVCKLFLCAAHQINLFQYFISYIVKMKNKQLRCTIQCSRDKQTFCCLNSDDIHQPVSYIFVDWCCAGWAIKRIINNLDQSKETLSKAAPQNSGKKRNQFVASWFSFWILDK